MNVKPKFSLYEDPIKLKTKIEDALRYYEMPKTLNVSKLKNWVQNTTSPAQFISRVFESAYFESELEAEKLLDLLVRFWNSTPRKELGGSSPQDQINKDIF